MRADRNAPNACRGCGCTDALSCWGGCCWIEPRLCSRCAMRGYYGDDLMPTCQPVTEEGKRRLAELVAAARYAAAAADAKHRRRE